MKTRPQFSSNGPILRMLTVLAILFALSAQSTAQTQTPGGTVISNQASVTYSDGTDSFSSLSNTVTVTVANVSGLTITPDAGTNPTVVASLNGVLFNFTVTNIGNFPNQVHFLASGASVRVVGPGTITRAVIDVVNPGTIDAGDTDIKTNGADVISSSLAQNGFINVLVEVSINAGATVGQTVQVLLGDTTTNSPSFDNQIADSSVNEVRTESATGINGLREARGDITVTVIEDALLRVTLSAPAGPVNLGSDITYTWQVCNTGSIAVLGRTVGSATEVFIVAPIPVNTVLKAGQTFPAGTQYTTSPLSTPPLSATWSTTPPVPLSSTTRVAFPGGATLGPSVCSANINLIVTVNTGINASIPIDEIGDTFGTNAASLPITDQSGDSTPNNGDGNADFNEGFVPGAGHGVLQRTTLTQVGVVLIGPNGFPGAVGPTSNDDDYTNKAVNTGIAGVPPGGLTTASGQLLYINTVQNSGNANDTLTIDAPIVPVGFTVEVSTDGGSTYTTVSGGASVSLPLAFGASANINVRITEPAGKTVLTGFDTKIRVTSGNTPGASNQTINRLYTGFVRLDKATTISNPTSNGGPTDPVPGAIITYTVTYTNISTTNGDSNCVKLTASNVVITEDGSAAPNNWGATTTNNGTPSDSGTGTVVTVSATKYTDTIAVLPPGASGVFTFKRLIN
jgi:hypothetical protein